MSFTWSHRNVLVTGATGLVGGWLTKHLNTRGANVIALIRDGVQRSLFETENLSAQTTVVHGALEDFNTLRRTCSEYDIDTVFHLGAQTIVGVAHKDPLTTFHANIQGTWNMLEAARQTGVRCVVTASSDKAYGNSVNLPYLETDPLQGIHPYDVSKSCADLISAAYAKTYGVGVAITRCGNIFGGGDLNLSRIFPGAIHATLRGERFRIRSDGRFVRDYLYVEDAVHAYLTTAQALLEGRMPSGEAFNFSLETKLTALDVVSRVHAVMGRSDLPPIVLNEACAEIREQFLDASKARRVLGWKPVYGLDEGIRQTVRWYTDYWDFAPNADSALPVAAGR